MVLWGEIKVDSDDLKHMVHRNGGFIELYNSIMTCLGDLGLLLAVPPLGGQVVWAGGWYLDYRYVILRRGIEAR